MRHLNLMRIQLLLGLALLGLHASPARSAPVWAEVFEGRQPDGERFNVRIWGDEFYRVVESLDGYTLVPDPKTGAACYARLSGDGSELVSTGIRLGGNITAISLPKHVRIRPEAAEAKAAAARNEAAISESLIMQAAGINTLAAAPPSSGNVQGITLLVDFSDDPWIVPPSALANYLNQVGYTGDGNNGSVRDYFYSVSNTDLTYTNYVPTAYYRAAHPKTYYEDPAQAFGSRASQLTLEALNSLDASGFDFSRYDSNHDGYLDAINCLYAGYIRNLWAQGLWPHAGRVPFERDGVVADRYQITAVKTGPTLYTFCHENGHMLCGWPDLYDYGSDSAGVGRYCIMCYGTSGTNPQEPCAYMKMFSNWATVNLLSFSEAGLSIPHSGTNICYKYPHPTRKNEYFLIENRQQIGRDSDLNTAGLAIWHVDENGSNNNQQMTPSQHYKVTLVQADGRWDLEHDVNQGDWTDLWAAPGYTVCSPTTNPNTHWWDATSSGLTVQNISAIASTMTFNATIYKDCNRNNVSDDQDIAEGTSPDCNSNHVPDECDIGSGTSGDCNSDGVPDCCELDSDTDGHIDVCDNCPVDPNSEQANNDLDTWGDVCDPDDDNDTIADLQDNCPFAVNPGQHDADGDTVGDVCDVCPDTIPGATADSKGCPQLIRADLDRDGDIDLSDFGYLQRCLTGEGVPQQEPTCVAARLDADADVDKDDLALFVGCISGPNVVGNPACEPAAGQ